MTYAWSYISVIFSDSLHQRVFHPLPSGEFFGAGGTHFGVEFVTHEALVDLAATGGEALAKALAILATSEIKSAIKVVIVSL